MRNYVYILECRDQSLYTGWTNDIYKRLKAHNDGAGAKYTRARRPVKLVYADAFSAKEAAMAEEYRIKQLKRAEKKQLIREKARSVFGPAQAGTGTDPEVSGGREGSFRMGKIFYLMGKSASGKDHIYEQLRNREDLGLLPLVIYTTRPMRSGETEGVNYHFTDEAGLAALQEAGKVIELRTYQTVQGPWSYFTADDDYLDLTKGSYLGIGTLQSYRKIRKYYGKDAVVPIYIEVSDGIRLRRALEREAHQEKPGYEEMCRRFLADQKDFSEEKLAAAGITERFSNDAALETCVDRIISEIRRNL